jgi:cytochrome b subunit of formate dehydrogenase
MTRINRFTPAQRLFHLLLMLSFLTQASTGLARLYIETNWGRFLASIFGGYNMALTIHWWVGIFMLALLGVHVIYVLIHIDWWRFPKSVYGPDSLLPRKEDLFQALQHIGWLLGIKEAPRFDRWGYWEKFDYLAVFWGITLLGGTGLILYNPIFFSRYIPGWLLNVLLWVHRIEAILAIAHVGTIHLVIGHLRRHNFPMDLAIFEGSVDLEKVRHERPAWVERLEQGGGPQKASVRYTPATLRFAYYVFGFSVVGCFLYLVVNGLMNAKEMFGYYFQS